MIFVDQLHNYKGLKKSLQNGVTLCLNHTEGVTFKSGETVFIKRPLRLTEQHRVQYITGKQWKERKYNVEEEEQTLPSPHHVQTGSRFKPAFHAA
jgi:hypothetical protein